MKFKQTGELFLKFPFHQKKLAFSQGFLVCKTIQYIETIAIKKDGEIYIQICNVHCQCYFGCGQFRISKKSLWKIQSTL